ncbi:ABC transporter ATP-binding protein [uncultured Pseudokineococcus sp.]|uniref:ABC transporter ATP-binding protein n=1 Tax=uncultured Pseudokineococcus sp. TaxID=1642928 RepID=UPI002638798F|nr:ABC transporter ATP-binding protein [uncultured Pseudokineococcus sp.]
MSEHRRRPTVVVDDVHVDYRVYASGKRATQERKLLRRGPNLRRARVVHALRGVSFTAHEGDSIGVVGHNGSGKSTLLRAVAGLSVPTRGAVYADGHPALLGVNAALINDLSGERNVILGGLAMGLTPEEIRERYDSIVEFAGIGDSIDLPMATYSAGMGARLRFAIAAAATHRVLLIDEALAVGDAAFRRRSEERIRELRDQAGTVFLVSHSMGTVRETCNRGLWIDHGELRADGPVDEVVDAYEASVR